MQRLRRLLLQWCPWGDLHLRGPCCCVRMNATVRKHCRKGGLATASESRGRRARQRARCWQTDQVQCSERGGSTQRARTQRESERDAAKHLRAAGCDRSGRQSAARIRRIPSCLLRTHLGVSIGTQTDRIRSTRLGMSMSVRRTSSAGTHRNGSFGTCRRPCAHTARPPAASARPRPSPATCPVCEGTGPERVQRDREKVKWRGGNEGRSTRENASNGVQRRWWEHQFAAQRAVPLWLGRGHRTQMKFRRV